MFEKYILKGNSICVVDLLLYVILHKCIINDLYLSWCSFIFSWVCFLLDFIHLLSHVTTFNTCNTVFLGYIIIFCTFYIQMHHM